MPVRYAGLVHTAVFRSFLLSICTHSILHYLCILKIYFQIHFKVNLYCNIFFIPLCYSIAWPPSLYHFRIHFPPIGPPFLSVLPAFPVFHLFHFDFSISLPLSPHCHLFFCLIHFTHKWALISHFSSLHLYTPFSIRPTEALP